MSLGNRNAQRHETVGVQKNAVVSEEYWDFQVNERVMTTDGVPGRVTAVQDGPYPGTEAYIVELDNGLGGGEYRTADLRSTSGPVTATDHTADADYPELGDILTQRPDIAQG